MARAKDKITVTCTRTGFTITGTPDEVAEHFYRDKSTKSGFSPWCKDAEREYNKAYRAGLEKANVSRKGDADDKGKATFDATMKRLGARTPRTSRKDGTRTPQAKKRTTTRRTARRAKKAA